MSCVMRVVSPVVGIPLWSSPVQQRERKSCGPSLTGRTPSLTTCQLDSDGVSTSSTGSSRRDFLNVAAASVTATTARFLNLPDSAQAAKRKPPPSDEEKKPEEDKYLSAYDAKVLANIRRKEALRVQLENAKAKAKSVVPQPDIAPIDIFGQASN